jgi:hypothetical protein
LNCLIAKSTFLFGLQVNHVTLRAGSSIVCNGGISTETHGSDAEAMKEVLEPNFCVLKQSVKTKQAGKVLMKAPCWLSG